MSLTGWLSKTKRATTNGNLGQSQKELEAKLIQRLQGRRIPNWQQFKQLPRVLTRRDRSIIGGALMVIVGAIVIMVSHYAVTHFVSIPKTGGQYTEGLIGAPQYINPILAQTNDVDTDLARLLFSGLVRYDRTLRVQPDLAERWEINADNTVYTFYLRRDALWHDGQPVTARDVVFTVQSIQDQDFRSPLLVSLRGVRIDAPDEYTVIFTLPSAYPSFLDVLTFGILPEHIWSEVAPANAALTEYNIEPIGSGPWKFDRYTKDKLGNMRSYTLIPFENFYGGQPYLEKIIFRFYPDFDSAIAALKNHSVDGVSFVPKEFISDLKTEKDITLHGMIFPQYTALFFNQQQNSILQSRAIRLALAQSIDKSHIVAQALQAQGQPIDGPILPISIDPTTVSSTPAFDLQQAAAALDADGWTAITAETYQNQRAQAQQITTEQASSTATTTPPDIEETLDPLQDIYRQKNGQILSITLTTVRQPENIRAAEMIRDAWRSIGIQTTLNIVEPGRIGREVIKPRNYEVLLFGVIVGSDADPRPFWHSSQVSDPGLNLAQYANRQADKALDEAGMATTTAERIAAYTRFYQIVSNDIPAVFLYNPTYTYATDRAIKGFDTRRVIVPADRFNNINQWYVRTQWQYQPR